VWKCVDDSDDTVEWYLHFTRHGVDRYMIWPEKKIAYRRIYTYSNSENKRNDNINKYQFKNDMVKHFYFPDSLYAKETGFYLKNVSKNTLNVYWSDYDEYHGMSQEYFPAKLSELEEKIKYYELMSYEILLGLRELGRNLEELQRFFND
jgi:hypothetical protein